MSRIVVSNRDILYVSAWNLTFRFAVSDCPNPASRYHNAPRDLKPSFAISSCAPRSQDDDALKTQLTLDLYSAVAPRIANCVVVRWFVFYGFCLGIILDRQLFTQQIKQARRCLEVTRLGDPGFVGDVQVAS